MGVAISTDFPAEQNVTATPPDSVPDWLSADSSAIGPTDSIGFSFTKNAAIVVFEDGATLAERQLAVALVGGRAVGGRPSLQAEGDYLVWLPDDGSGSQLLTATRRLRALPQVRIALPMIHLSEMYLRPNDAGDWQKSKWRLDPANADWGDERWALAEIEAPMAWGCSVGGTETIVIPVSLVLCGLLRSSHRALAGHYTAYGNPFPTRVRWRPLHTRSGQDRTRNGYGQCAVGVLRSTVIRDLSNRPRRVPAH